MYCNVPTSAPTSVCCVVTAKSESVRTRDPEVNHLGISLPIDQNIARLEIAMNDALLVTMMYRIAHPSEEFQLLSNIEFLINGELIERLGARNELHREEWNAAGAVVPGTRLVDLRDTRMMQARQHLRFKLESSQGAAASDCPAS